MSFACHVTAMLLFCWRWFLCTAASSVAAFAQSPLRLRFSPVRLNSKHLLLEEHTGTGDEGLIGGQSMLAHRAASIRIGIY